MTTSRHVVVVGAGIVGANVVDELVSRGWKNITVVEQGLLRAPDGSTPLDPGLVFQTNASKSMSLFASYTVKKLHALEKDGQKCFDQVGGLEVATSLERFEEIKRKQGFASSWGIDARILTAQECLHLYPSLNGDVVFGGLHTPTDGLAHSVRAVQSLIERSQDAGVRFLQNTVVTGIQKDDDRVTGVETSIGIISADAVVCCAGFWGVEIAAMVDLPLPLLPLAHQYAKTTAVPNAADSDSTTTGSPLPILCYQDQDLYYRTHGSQYGIGYYGHKPMPVVPESLRATSDNTNEKTAPARLDFTPEDFDPAWAASQKLLPALAQCKIDEGFNGVMSFTPDGKPLIGEHPTLDGFYVAESVWTTHAAGVARALVDIITTGSSKIDISDCELSRFEEIQLSSSYVDQTGQQSFQEVFDIIHPLQPRSGPRNLRLSPFYTRQCEFDAAFVEAAAWERPHYYDSNVKLIKDLPPEWQPVERDEWSNRYYSPIGAAEAWKTRTAVAMYDMTPLRRVEVYGPGAVDMLQYLTTGDVSKKPGAVTYALMLNEDGGVRSDITVARLDNKKFQLGLNSPIDVIYLTREANKRSQNSPAHWVEVRDITGGTCCIGFWGPFALDVVNTVTSDDFSNKGLRYFRLKKARISGIPVTAMRLSYIGELGWEIYTSAENGQRLWDVLWNAGQPWGIIAAGRIALNSLRLEKGFRAWGIDMTTEHNPYEAGVGFAIKKDKTGYVGEAAIRMLCNNEPRRRLRCLTVNDGRTIMFGNEPMYHKGRTVGYVTSSAFGYTIGKPIVYAYAESTVREGDVVELEYFGRRVEATVCAEPLYDPEHHRLKGRATVSAAEPEVEAKVEPLAEPKIESKIEAPPQFPVTINPGGRELKN